MTYERTCKYGCGIQLGEIDKKNKYLETDGNTLHTRERCESLKNQVREITLQEVIKKLESIGIIINVERLLKQ